MELTNIDPAVREQILKRASISLCPNIQVRASVFVCVLYRLCVQYIVDVIRVVQIFVWLLDSFTLFSIVLSISLVIFLSFVFFLLSLSIFLFLSRSFFFFLCFFLVLSVSRSCFALHLLTHACLSYEGPSDGWTDGEPAKAL